MVGRGGLLGSIDDRGADGDEGDGGVKVRPCVFTLLYFFGSSDVESRSYKLQPHIFED